MQAFNGLMVLVADDSSDNQFLIKTFLVKNGAGVDVVGNGEEAIAVVAGHAINYYDAILMDIQMPVMDGYQATVNLRSLGYKRPIIALTALALDEYRAEAIKCGFTAYVTKPLNYDYLTSLITGVTGGQQT